jgi:hypothetical protein
MGTGSTGRAAGYRMCFPISGFQTIIGYREESGKL